VAFAAMFQSRAVHLEDFTLDAGLTTNGVPWLAIVDRTNYYGGYQVEISTNLANWNTFGTFLNLLAPYRDSGRYWAGAALFSRVRGADACLHQPGGQPNNALDV
jgi:beta-xylosidase